MLQNLVFWSYEVKFKHLTDINSCLEPELLSFYKFPGDDIPIIRGSALSALQGTNDEIGRQAILKLMDAVDEYIPDPVRVLDKPFLMPIEDVFSIQVY